MELSTARRWHTLTPQTALEELDSRPGGLSDDEAANRLLRICARFRAELLRIAYPLWSRLAEQHGCGHNRPGKRPAPCLVNAGDQRTGPQRGTEFV